MIAGIGIRFYGADARRTRFGKLVRAAARLVGEHKGNAPALGVYFHLPGEFGGPNFDHGKVASYRPEKKVVLIDIPVSAEVMEGDDALRALILELRGANALAFDYFKRQGEEFDLRAAEAEVSQLEEKLRSGQGDPPR